MTANIGEDEHGVNFIWECVPIMIQKVEDLATTKYNHGTEFVDEFNKIWLEGVGVALNPKNGKLLHNELERSGVDNIYAIGDMLGGKRELTPVAIQVGKRLARRLVRI